MNMQQFENPSAEYRIHPFWFWNGAMEDDEIRRQIAEMSDKGVGGFFLCARQGLTIPYLSQAWFEKVRMAVEAAKSHNMHVWLYDEYPYPSGIAGGEVILQHPEAKHVTLEHRTVRAKGGERLSIELPWGRVLYAKAAPVQADGAIAWQQAIDIASHIGNIQADPVFQKTGLTAYTQKRFFTYRTVLQLVWEVPPGEWEVTVFQEKEIEDFKYYGTFVDPCNREAMETFIRLTHDRYVPVVGDHFGDTVKGMFTDEIGLLGRIPWSPHIAAEFEARNGYSLLAQLPALVDGSYGDAAKVRYDYYQTVHLLLREAYHEKVHDWCERNGLEYVAEVPAVRLTTQKHSHVPGGDSAHEKLGRSLDWVLRKYYGSIRANPKMVSSLSRQLGRTRNLIECFHSVGWSMTLQDARWMIDRLAALGTNFFNFHAFYYTMDALAKHDAPPSQFLQNPYWKHFRLLGDYTGRLSYLMSVGKADVRIALLDPVTSMWTHMGNPFHSFDYSGNDGDEKSRLELLKRDWADIGVGLLKHRFDYDHLDPELLAEADVTGGTIALGHAAYTVLIIPPVTNLEAAAWQTIRAFLEAGGTVISVGLLPYDVIEAGSPDETEGMLVFGVAQPPASAYWAGTRAAAAGEADAAAQQAAAQGPSGGAYFLPVSAECGVAGLLPPLVALLDEVEPRPVTVDAEADAQCFLMQTRLMGDGSAVVFISNQEGAEQQVSITVAAERLFSKEAAAGCSGLRASLLDLETGGSHPLSVQRCAADARWQAKLTLAPYEAQLVKLEADSGDAASAPSTDNTAVSSAWQLRIDAAAAWDISPETKNVVRFDDFLLSTGENGEGPEWPVKTKTFIDQCSDLAENRSFAVRMQQTFGTPMRVNMAYPVSCIYRAEFVAGTVPADCELFMDQSAIAGDWLLYINGEQVNRDRFAAAEVYDHRNIAAPIADLLRTGTNEIKVQVVIAHDWDGVTDPLYIRGSFGVSFGNDGGPVLVEAPRKVNAIEGDPVIGYPYYAGQLSYRRMIEVPEKPDTERFELVFGGWDPHFHDCMEVLINGRSLGVRPWTPYRWTGAVEWLREGSNALEVRVTNTLVGLLDGTTFDYRSHTLKPFVEAAQSGGGSPAHVR
ncbi:glycosyl hydrolase [Paenibacillus xerothermodurans]|nr:glycosyl hydrolase [Paenibacillus xerothermodurans]